MVKPKPNEAERQEKTRELEKRLVKELWPVLVMVPAFFGVTTKFTVQLATMAANQSSAP